MNYDSSETAVKINDYVLSLLSDKLRPVCKNYITAYPAVSEIRLHLDGPLVLNNRGKNIITNVKCTQSDIDTCISRMTESNYIKYEEMMRNGYITLKNGCRAGVCGDVFVSEGNIKLLKYVDHINIRLPAVLTVKCTDILEYLEQKSHSASILVISSPGIGKTTLLRSLVYALSSEPYGKRVAAIDTNRELRLPFYDGNAVCDILSGYPKTTGISIATKYFSPEYIVCDELGERNETEKILELTHTGVSLIASAHAESFSDALLRENLRPLFDNGVFNAIVRLTRSETKIMYEIRSVASLINK